MTNGEFSGSSSSSTWPVSYDTAARSTDAGSYAAGGSGSLSSGSAAYNMAQADGDAWNDRPTSVRGGSASDTCQYSSVVPASQRRPQSMHSTDVQEYVLLPSDFFSFGYVHHFKVLIDIVQFLL